MIKQKALIIVVLLLAGLFLAPTPTVSADYSSDSIANTIKSKCDVALTKYAGDKSSSDFKTFQDACEGTGQYGKNATDKPERAKRLIDICGFEQFLKQASPKYDVYNGPSGTIQDGRCVQILTNSELDQTASTAYGGFSTNKNAGSAKHQCGSGSSAVAVSVDIGCKGDDCLSGKSPTYCASDNNAITDAVFAIIRLLSDGVGLIIIGSIAYAGIQYSASRDDPQAVAAAVNRIKSSLTALLIFIFGYAILNYLIPAGFLK